MYKVLEQGYDEIWCSGPFVCGETWLYLKKWPSGSHPIHSLQVEKRLSMTYYFCIPLYWLRWPWVAWPATARAGGSKLTCFPCRYPCTCTQHNRVLSSFNNKFNIVSALFVHQPLTLPQKIDSREGWFWCKKGVACEWGKMNFYLKTPPFVPVFGLFAAKCTAIWCKTHCNMVLNAVHFGAKCSAFWC